MFMPKVSKLIAAHLYFIHWVCVRVEADGASRWGLYITNGLLRSNFHGCVIDTLACTHSVFQSWIVIHIPLLAIHSSGQNLTKCIWAVFLVPLLNHPHPAHLCYFKFWASPWSSYFTTGKIGGFLFWSGEQYPVAVVWCVFLKKQTNMEDLQKSDI